MSALDELHDWYQQDVRRVSMIKKKYPTISCFQYVSFDNRLSPLPTQIENKRDCPLLCSLQASDRSSDLLARGRYGSWSSRRQGNFAQRNLSGFSDPDFAHTPQGAMPKLSLRRIFYESPRCLMTITMAATRFILPAGDRARPAPLRRCARRRTAGSRSRASHAARRRKAPRCSRRAAPP